MKEDVLILDIINVCMCVKESENEREKERETEREREEERKRLPKPHTGAWTSFILCCLMLWMTPGMSTTPSFSALSSTWLMVMKVPVRPTPALHRAQHAL